MHPRNDNGPNFFFIGLSAAVLAALVFLSRNLHRLLSALSSS